MSGAISLAEFVAAVRGRLIVSCQANEGHALRDTPTMMRMALAAQAGGAAAIRCGGVGGIADVAAVVAAVSLPVIGLTKDGLTGVYITPTVAAALAVVQAGAAIVAADATRRQRPDGLPFASTVEAVHQVGRLVMADVATLDEGLAAVRDGADIVATTLSGYTDNGPVPEGPDVSLVRALRQALPHTVIVAEGRYHSPDQAAAAIAAGATAVVVGTAITDPTWLTAAYVARLKRR